MDAQQIIDALGELGCRISVTDGKPSLTKPPGFAYEPELADLMDLVRANRQAILDHFQTPTCDPWQCKMCRRTFFVPLAEVKEVIQSPHYCDRAACPLK